MNERIDHCLYQAGLTASGCWDELGTYEQEAIERFAEFIVKECAEIARLNTRVDSKVYLMIKEHFGVKE